MPGQIYVSAIAAFLSHQGADQHQYADDTQLFTSISQSSASADLHILKSVLAVLSQWFSLNSLALNPDKYDAILLGTRQRNGTLSSISHILNRLSQFPSPTVWHKLTFMC
jgi:hypothetical protein